MDSHQRHLPGSIQVEQLSSSLQDVTLSGGKHESKIKRKRKYVTRIYSL